MRPALIPMMKRHALFPALLSLLLPLTLIPPGANGSLPGGTASPGAVPLDQQETWIVVSGEKLDLGRQLASMIEEATGTSLDVVLDSELEPPDWKARHFIALGRFSNNAVILKLYKNRLVFVDPIFPGPGGVHVRTLASPFHEGRHIVVLGGSDRDGTEGSVRAFMELLPDDANDIPSLHFHQSDRLPRPAPGPEERKELLENNIALYDISRGRRVLRAITTYGMNYHLTRDDGWAELFRDQLYHYIRESRGRGEWDWSPMLALYFELSEIIDTWSLIENGDFFTSSDREYIMEAFHDLTVDVLLEGTYLNERANPRGEPRQNHTTRAALSLDASIRYFEKHGRDVSEWLELVLPIFEGQLRSYRSDDDGPFYGFYGQTHTFAFFAARDMDRVTRKGFLDKAGDLAILFTDNHRSPVTFGDVGGYRGFDDLAFQAAHGVALGIAAWMHGDPGHQWAYQWMNEGKQRSIGRQGIMNSFSYALDHDQDLEPPERFLGLTYILQDRGLLEMVSTRAMRPEWTPLHGRDYLDKLTLRPSFDPRDEYLLLSGLSALSHGHEDGNAILRLTWKDRIWIADLDYIRTHPRYNNSIDVIVDGGTAPLPPIAELRGRVQSPGGALLQSRIENYTQTHWDRNIAWTPGEYFLVLDRIEARKTAHYDLNKKWRLLGSEQLSGNRATMHQDGVEFHLIGGDNSSKTFVRETPGQADWSRYPHASSGFKIYQQRLERDLTAGGEIWFAELLHAVGEGEARHLDLLPVDDSMWVVFRDGTPHALAGSAKGGRTIGELKLEAEVFHLSVDRLDAIGVTSLSTPAGAFTSGTPADMSLLPDGSGHVYSTGLPVIRTSDGISASELDNPVVPGEARLTLEVAGLDFASLKEAVKEFGRDARPQLPLEKPLPYSFGLQAHDALDLGAAATLLAHAGEVGEGALRIGLEDGRLLTLEGKEEAAPELNVSHEVRSVATHENLLFVGDSDAGISAFRDGDRLWHVQLGINIGRQEKIVRLGVIDTHRGPRLIVATEGWRVHSYTLEGEEEWMAPFNYHAATELLLADVTGDGRAEIIVGNEYVTPVHVFDDEGESIWFAWEQLGSESHSTTEFLGIHAHALEFKQLARDDEPGLLLGNGMDEVIFLDGHDGSVRWRANVGGEAWHLVTADFTGNGDREVMVGTGSGYLILIDAHGNRQWEQKLTGPVNAMDSYFSSRVGGHFVAIGTEAGEVAVYDGGGNSLARGYDVHPIEFLRITEADGSVSIHTVSLEGTLRQWDFRYPRSAYPPQYRTDRHRF